MSKQGTLTKKQIARLRNRRDWMILRHVRLQQGEHDRISEDELMAKLAKEDDGKTREQREQDSEAWSAKTQMIRNRITGKRTKSKERWNRFAGTSGGGARGL